MNSQCATGIRSRILYVTPVSPFSTKSGSEQRSALLLEAAATLGTVDVLQLSEGPELHIEREDAAHLGRYLGGGLWFKATAPSPRWVLRRFKPNAKLTALLHQTLPYPLAKYTLVLGRYLWPVSQVSWPKEVPLVTDLDDWRYRFSQAEHLRFKHVQLRFKKWLSCRLAQHELYRLTGALAVSMQDMRELSPLLPTHLLPNIPARMPAQVSPPPGQRRVLFVGAMWYAPNAEAVEWFLATVWPTVRARQPDASLRLIGPGPEPLRRRWGATAGVSAPGFVDDLDEEYRQADVVVVPMLSGGGSNIKAVEAMAHGRAVVVSDLVHSAFSQQCRNNRDYIVASCSNTFSESVLQLLARRDEASHRGQQARTTVLREFSKRPILTQTVKWLRERRNEAAATRA